MCTRIDGAKVAKDIREKLKEEVERMELKEDDVKPGLAIVLVGNRTDSATYVRFKKKACDEIGIVNIDVHLDETVSEEEVLSTVRSLNEDQRVHGILIQLPLPSHISEERVLREVSLEKDVDGFHPFHIGQLAMKRSLSSICLPCTPKGCIRLLDEYGIELEGKHVVILGRSNIVGLPVALLALHSNATITICHSRTKDLPSITRQADILICAVGRTQMVKADWVKDGVVIIDVGINELVDPSKKRGYRLVGDVDSSVEEKASAMTPVPGGVGPMTIAMLCENLLAAYQRSLK